MSTRKPSSNAEKVPSTKDLTLCANTQSQKEKSSVCSEDESHRSHNLLDELVNAFLEDDQLQDEDDEPIKQIQPKSKGLIHFQRHSQLLMAVVEPGTFTLRYANDYFCSLLGIAGTGSELEEREIHVPDL